MIGRRAVPAPVVWFEGGVIPPDAGVLARDDNIFATDMKVAPDLCGANADEVRAWPSDFIGGTHHCGWKFIFDLRVADNPQNVVALENCVQLRLSNLIGHDQVADV